MTIGARGRTHGQANKDTTAGTGHNVLDDFESGVCRPFYEDLMN